MLNGEKMWISLADVADHFLVIAWTDQEKKKNRDHSGLSAFIVERAFKGFRSYTMKEKWGILAGNTGFFKMDDVEVPEENILGRLGEDQDFAAIVMDLWTSGTTPDERARAFAALGERLSVAKTDYQKTQSLDRALFGEDYEA